MSIYLKYFVTVMTNTWQWIGLGAQQTLNEWISDWMDTCVEGKNQPTVVFDSSSLFTFWLLGAVALGHLRVLPPESQTTPACSGSELSAFANSLNTCWRWIMIAWSALGSTSSAGSLWHLTGGHEFIPLKCSLPSCGAGLSLAAKEGSQTRSPLLERVGRWPTSPGLQLSNLGPGAAQRPTCHCCSPLNKPH
jgi:hypothetical protein